MKKSILEHLKAAPYLQTWLREDLPAKWSYANPTRTGDIVVSLAPGYDFSSKDITAPTPAESLGGMKGMHGYDPEQDPLMQGFAVLCRIGATELGKTSARLKRRDSIQPWRNSGNSTRFRGDRATDCERA